MENILIKGNNKFPEIDFNASTGNLSIKGRGVPYSGDDFDYFIPLLDWMKEYVLSPCKQTTMHVQLDFFGTWVAKFLLQLFKLLDQIYLGGHEVCINWYYIEDDLEMMESGSDYKIILNLPFNIVIY